MLKSLTRSLLVTGLALSGAAAEEGADAVAAPAPAPATYQHDVGGEFQIYPTGFIIAARYRHLFHPNLAWMGYLGANFTDRDDEGEHDHEEGEGPGFGAALRWYLEDGGTGLYAGGRADVWFLEIDWRDDGFLFFDRAGTTDVIVLQPTGQVGWAWSLADDRFQLETGLSLGLEINVREDGEGVGDGAIILGGVSGSWRF